MAKSSWSHALVWASLAGTLVGCSTVPDSAAPARPPVLNPLANADTGNDEPVPRAEPPSRSGNPDTYVVFGRRYRVKETSAGYREEGVASWYGRDFHGRKTSSGPPYDMFDLTAAHKSLPLPTYVRVTNLENGRNVVVRINDRGPFVGRRLIDLSYAAAGRLDMLEQGTARVEVVALEPYQYLPKLAARRATAQERLASRRALGPEPKTALASIEFAREKPVRVVANRTPPVRLAAVERNGSRSRAPLRLAAADVERYAPKSSPRSADGPKPTVRDDNQNRKSANIRLVSAPPASRARGALEGPRMPAATGGNRKGKSDPAGRGDARSSRNRPASPARRDSRAESGPARPMGVRLVSLKLNRSRGTAD